MRKCTKKVIFSLILLLVVTLLAPQILSLLGLPDYCQIVKGNKELLKIHLPFVVSVKSNSQGALKINGQQASDEGLNINLAKPLALQSSTIGKYNLNFRLFGLIPLREMTVNVIPEIKVIPGGQSIGVILKSDGIMVVRGSYVIDKNNQKRFPAKEAGIEVGDSLLEVNGVKIKNKHHLAQLIDKYGKKGKKLRVKIRNQEEKIVYKIVKPVKSKNGYYMIGIYVDDGAAGVGTLTFYHPQQKYYGALGHMITEANTQLKINVGDGEIVKANISGINQGRDGLPGEKLGTFFNGESILGDIHKNNYLGIYGKLSITPKHPYFKHPIPVATPSEINEGLADIYTVIHGGEIQKFKVKIKKVRRQYRPAEKGLIIEIVDPRLLKRTGGIVQGMSGSPIVQNGKLVGAVTHVFVNDATCGYGILAQWMIMQTGLLNQQNNTRELAS